MAELLFVELFPLPTFVLARWNVDTVSKTLYQHLRPNRCKEIGEFLDSAAGGD
jgi:hypothetical protein